MGSAGIRKKIRAFLKFWVTPAQPFDPKIRYPPRASLYLLVSIGIVFLEWFYFYAEVPYDTIPSKSVFWLSLVVWAMPPIFVEWAYRNASSKREINAYLNMMIGVGMVAIALGISVNRVDALLPVVAAGLPGLLAGGLIGSDSTLLLKLYKEKYSKTNKQHGAGVATESTTRPSSPRDPEQTQLD